MKKAISSFAAIAIILSVFSFFTPAKAATLNSRAGIVSTSSGNLNVRSGKSTSSTIITSLKKGTYVTLIEKSGEWWKVEYARGSYGYCHESYIKTVTSSTAIVNTQSGNLNVRSGAGTSYKVVDRLPKGETVIILSKGTEWDKILYHGTKVGYVSRKYLSKYPPISMKIPDFKQTDSRWANVLIGNSGKTIGKIGCTTTAIAMMESYRTGKTIYPDAMSKKLSYSSSVDLYWPKDYEVILDSKAYLETIYKILKQNKPVLFGSKSSTGKQHWVVITGYKGSDTLKASDFTINDPGSKSRTNLQHLLNSYPNFYKMFYYK